MISKKYGMGNALVMEEAMKQQSEQIQAAMQTGGMSLENIAETKGIDLDSMSSTMTKQTPSSQLMPQPKILPSTSAFNQGGMENNNYRMPGWFADLFTPGGARGKEQLEALLSLSKIQQTHIVFMNHLILQILFTTEGAENTEKKYLSNKFKTKSPNLFTFPKIPG